MYILNLVNIDNYAWYTKNVYARKFRGLYSDMEKTSGGNCQKLQKFLHKFSKEVVFNKKQDLFFA